MGAWQYDTYAFGKTFEAAYYTAVEDARYEHGHDPYSGTIACSHGAREGTLPAGWSTDEWIAILYLITEAGGTLNAVPPIRRKFATEWERDAYSRDRKLIAKFLKLDYRTQREVERDAEYADEKGGYAVGVELPPKEQRARRATFGPKGKQGRWYRFTGLAPS